MQRTIDHGVSESLVRGMLEHDERMLGLVTSAPLRLLAIQLAFEGLPGRQIETSDAESGVNDREDVYDDWDPLAPDWGDGIAGIAVSGNPFNLLSHLDACGALESILEAERCEAIESSTCETLKRASQLFDKLAECDRADEFADALSDPDVFEGLLREFDIV